MKKRKTGWLIAVSCLFIILQCMAYYGTYMTARINGARIGAAQVFLAWYPGEPLIGNIAAGLGYNFTLIIGIVLLCLAFRFKRVNKQIDAREADTKGGPVQ